MNKPQTARRGRGRNPKRNKPGNSGRNEFRAKGNPKQLLDKYKSLARDALQSGDRVLAENYFQHADHYQRVLNERNGLNAGVYQDPESYAGEQSDEEDEDPQPRRRRSRSQRSEDAEAAERERQVVDTDDPRQRSNSDRDGDEKAAGASAEETTEVKRLRRPRRSAKASAPGNDDASKASAADTAAE